jgi:hypothetical protein
MTDVSRVQFVGKDPLTLLPLSTTTTITHLHSFDSLIYYIGEAGPRQSFGLWI